MKKFMFAVLAILLVSGTVYASDLELSGDFYVRGSYFNNVGVSLDSDDDYSAVSNYDQDLNITGRFGISDATFVTFRVAMRDMTWGVAQTTDGSDDFDDNFAVERAWGGHTFGTGTKLETGLMTGGGWASSFGEVTGGKWRIKATQPTGFGALIGVVEKTAEEGSGGAGGEDTEADDVDTYLIALVTKMGDINVLPALAYRTIGNTGAAGDDKQDTLVQFVLGADGDFGAFAFTFEFDYLGLSYDATDADDMSLYGVYLDVSTTMDALNVGAFLAYGSVDSDTGIGFSFGDDFDGNGSEMIGNEFSFGAADAIGGSTYVGAYLGYAISDAMSASAHVGYAMANSDLGTVAATYAGAMEDDTATALSLGGAYKISDAVTYSVGFGYATISRDVGDDPDAGTKLWHKLAFAF